MHFAWWWWWLAILLFLREDLPLIALAHVSSSIWGAAAAPLFQFLCSPSTFGRRIAQPNRVVATKLKRIPLPKKDISLGRRLSAVAWFQFPTAATKRKNRLQRSPIEICVWLKEPAQVNKSCGFDFCTKPDLIVWAVNYFAGWRRSRIDKSFVVPVGLH